MLSEYIVCVIVSEVTSIQCTGKDCFLWDVRKTNAKITHSSVCIKNCVSFKIEINHLVKEK